LDVASFAKPTYHERLRIVLVVSIQWDCGHLATLANIRLHEVPSNNCITYPFHGSAPLT